MNIIVCENLVKQYGRIKALDGLDAVIEENRITGLIGRNGAGKTTLLKILAGYIRKTSGITEVLGENPFNSLRVASNLILIDDQMQLPATLHLEEILHSAASFYPGWDAGLALGLMDYFHINPKSHHHQLSKGMKSTFNMILGLSARCPLTLFDEPTTGMDAAVRKDFYRAVLKDYLAHPRTILISSHLLLELEDIIEDILLLKEGRKRLHLPVADMKTYAVGLRGRASAIEGLMADREILFRESFGKDSLHVVIQNSSSGESLIQRARAAGAEVIPVETQDLCIYLTANHKGGIDDVFARNEVI